jgi:predicted dehydrogenase
VDYRESYSASAAAGGGCILDCIHEIDLAVWYLGRVARVFCVAEHLSELEIDAEDVAMLTCRHEGGPLSQIHLDYVQRTYERGCQVVGDRGSVFWDFRAGEVRHYEADADRWTAFRQPDGWQVNRMYEDELGHFLSCVRESRQTTLPVAAALDVMRVALAAKASARSGAAVRTEDVI